MKILGFFFTIAVVALLFSGCKYDFIVPEEVPDPTDTTVVVSFSEEIVPIFTENNNCTQCHSTGGQMPDLTAGNAYSSINNSRYINKGTPEESLIYTKPNPATSGHSQKKYTEAQAGLILKWIIQGAKNN